MSDTFTASNGLQVAWMPDDRGMKVLQTNAEYAKRCLPEYGWRVVGGAIGASGYPGFTEESANAVALREFFLHERDKELGRWRWPENRAFVVYPQPDGTVTVLDEVIGDGLFVRYGRATDEQTAECAAARAYFDAHPEPRPWHDAKPGEVWAITYEGVEQAWGVGFDGPPDMRFVFACGDSRISASDVEISAGRRIWPEVTP